MLGKLRNIRATAVKTAAVVAVAMLLSVGIVVSTPGNAQALVPAPLVGPVLVGGATTVAGAVGTGVVVATGVGAVVVIGGGIILALHNSGSFSFPWEDSDNPYTGGQVTGPPGTISTKINYVHEPDNNVPDQISVNFSGKLSSDTRSAWYHYRMTCMSLLGKKYTQDSYAPNRAGEVTPMSMGNASIGSNMFSCPSASSPETARLVSLSIIPAAAPEAWKDPYYWGGDTVQAASYQNSYFKPRATEVSYRTQVKCVKSNGTESTLTSNRPAMGGQVNIPSCESAGKGVGKEVITEVIDEEGNANPVPLLKIDSGTAYPGCDATLGQTCVMEVYYRGSACAVGQTGCTDWAARVRVDPSPYECHYGANIVPMSECSVLEGSYKPGGTPVVQANLDGDPDTWTDPATVPGYMPHEQGPNGQPQPIPGGTPVPEPGTNPGTGTSPGTGTNPGTVTDVVTNPGSSPEGENGNCWSGSSGWNPIEWVFMPVKCALSWAFVPKMDISDRVGDIGNEFRTTAPFSWMVSPVFGPMAQACPDLEIVVGDFRANPICHSTFTDAIRQSRPLLLALMTTAMVWPLIRSIWYASIPLLNIYPTGGK